MFLQNSYLNNQSYLYHESQPMVRQIVNLYVNCLKSYNSLLKLSIEEIFIDFFCNHEKG